MAIRTAVFLGQIVGIPDARAALPPIEPSGNPPYHPTMLNRSRVPAFRSLRALPRTLLLAAWMTNVAFTALPAQAQQTYILDKQDTWQPEREIDPASPEGQLAEAKRTLASGDAQRAETLLTQWIERYERHPLVAEAYLLRGDAKSDGGDEYEGLFDYEYVARLYPGTETFVVACQRELAIAKQYVAGRKRKQWGIRWADAKADGEELLIRIQERLPGSRLAEEAGIELADYYFNERQMTLAAEAYDLFILNYPRSTLIDKARRRLIYSHLATFKGPAYGAQGLYEARDRLHQLQVQQPAEAQRMGADALLTRVDESDAQKMLVIARYYDKTGEPISAEFTIRRLVQRYPRTSATAEALRFVPQVVAKLPEQLRKSVPDYATIAAGLLDQPAANAPSNGFIAPAATQPAASPVKEGS